MKNRRAALLHDIGKAVDHELEGSHAIIGAELVRKYGESPKIVNAIAAHQRVSDVTALIVRAQLAARVPSMLRNEQNTF